MSYRRSAGRGRKVFRSTATVAAVTLLIAGGFMVAEADGNEPAFKKRFYVGAGVGVTQLEPKVPHNSLSVTEDQDTGFHLAAGFDFNSRLSAEAYFADLGSADIAFLGTDVGSIDYQVFGVSALVYFLNSSSGLSGSNAGGLARREGLSLYGRAGLGAVDAESEIDHKVNHEVHLALGLGAEYGFRNGFAVRGEYIAMDTDMHYATVSLIKRFGKPGSAAPAAPLVTTAIEAPKTDNTPTPVAPVSLPFPTVNFAFDKSNINAEAARKLDSIVDVMLDSDIKVVLEGHTDWISTEQYNYDLALRRSESVRRYLEAKGIGRDRMMVRGFGETRPIASNNTAEGRAANRRVDIRIR